jgi:hypothetical protein
MKLVVVLVIVDWVVLEVVLLERLVVKADTTYGSIQSH